MLFFPFFWVAVLVVLSIFGLVGCARSDSSRRGSSPSRGRKGTGSVELGDVRRASGRHRRASQSHSLRDSASAGSASGSTQQLGPSVAGIAGDNGGSSSSSSATQATPASPSSVRKLKRTLSGQRAKAAEQPKPRKKLVIVEQANRVREFVSKAEELEAMYPKCDRCDMFLDRMYVLAGGQRYHRKCAIQIEMKLRLREADKLEISLRDRLLPRLKDVRTVLSGIKATTVKRSASGKGHTIADTDAVSEGLLTKLLKLEAGVQADIKQLKRELRSYQDVLWQDRQAMHHRKVDEDTGKKVDVQTEWESLHSRHEALLGSIDQLRKTVVKQLEALVKALDAWETHQEAKRTQKVIPLRDGKIAPFARVSATTDALDASGQAQSPAAKLKFSEGRARSMSAPVLVKDPVSGSVDLTKLTRELEQFKDEIKTSVSAMKRPRTRTEAAFPVKDYKRFKEVRRQSLTLQRQLASMPGGLEAVWEAQGLTTGSGIRSAANAARPRDRRFSVSGASGIGALETHGHTPKPSVKEVHPSKMVKSSPSKSSSTSPGKQSKKSKKSKKGKSSSGSALAAVKLPVLDDGEESDTGLGQRWHSRFGKFSDDDSDISNPYDTSSDSATEEEENLPDVLIDHVCACCGGDLTEQRFVVKSAKRYHLDCWAEMKRGR